MWVSVAATRALYDEERAEFWDYVDTLTEHHRASASLCAGWSVGDVIAHVAAWEQLLGFDHLTEVPGRLLAYLRLWLRSRGSFERMNRRIIAPSAVAPAFDRHLFDRIAPGAQLAELVIHHQDIRRALGHHRDIRSDRLAAALRGMARHPAFDLRATRRHTWYANDIDWRFGRGSIRLTGPGEAILLALAGRRSAFEQLESTGSIE